MGQTVREDLTMGKMNMSFEEFMEKMYGGGKLTEPTREELEEVGRVMQEAARRMSFPCCQRRRRDTWRRRNEKW